MNRAQRIVQVCGRGLLGLIYFLAGLGIITGWDLAAQRLSQLGLPWVPHLLGLASVILLVGGLSVILGYRARVGATVLILYTVLVNFLFYDFWNVAEELRHIHFVVFLSNLGVIGGLLIVVGFGPGVWSLDRTQ